MEFVSEDLAKKLTNKGCPDWAYCDTSYIPTISEVLKWLREEEEIYIVIEPFPTMSTKNKICWSWGFKRNSDGAYIEHTFVDDLSYATYEQAALAGIEYILDNLI